MDFIFFSLDFGTIFIRVANSFASHAAGITGGLAVDLRQCIYFGRKLLVTLWWVHLKHGANSLFYSINSKATTFADLYTGKSLLFTLQTAKCLYSTTTSRSCSSSSSESESSPLFFICASYSYLVLWLK